MKIFIFSFLLLLFSLPIQAREYDLGLRYKVIPILPYTKIDKLNSEDQIKETIKKVYDTSWIDDKTQKYGLAMSFSLAQFCTGMSEGYHFNGKDGYIVNDGNYHLYQTIGRASWLSTGYFVYATIDNDRIAWYSKAGRIIGSALIARNFFEWGYKWERYNNPFDYSEVHNEKAIVYFRISKGEIIEAYIGTGKLSGPIVDAACMLTGIFLLNL
jgi:hypothetical protein